MTEESKWIEIEGEKYLKEQISKELEPYTYETINKLKAEAATLNFKETTNQKDNHT